MNAYAFWAAAINGEKPRMVVDQPELGFYRRTITERNDKGNSFRIGWEPVAVFMDGDVMVARVGNREITDPDKLNELWSWIASNAISEEWYRAVSERGEPWPDAHDPSKNLRAKEDELFIASMKRESWAIPTVLAEESPEQKLARELDELAKGIPTYAKIEDDNLLSQAHDLRDKIKKIETSATKARKEEKDEYLKKGQAIDAKWRGVVTAAQERYAELSVPMNAWINEKLEAQRLRDEQEAKTKLEHDEAVADATAKNAPPPPAPAPAPLSNIPAPSLQVRSGGGARASNVKTTKVVTITDEAAVYKHFAGSVELTSVLLKLATVAVNADLNVPGTTWKPQAKV